MNSINRDRPKERIPDILFLCNRDGKAIGIWNAHMAVVIWPDRHYFQSSEPMPANRTTLTRKSGLHKPWNVVRHSAETHRDNGQSFKIYSFTDKFF